MKSSDLFVKALENEGVEYIFGVPGEENLDFLESLRTSKIRLIVTRHEQAAAFMAATYGRLTGKPGVCLSTLGPGATNLVTGAAYATLGGMPMLMITGQKPIRSSKQGHFQIIDVVGMMKPLTKYAIQIVSGSSIPARVREAFRVATEERPGAVHLELPEDIAAEDVDDAHAHVFPVNQIRRPGAEEKAVATAVAMIEKAKHPLILVGAGANRQRVAKVLREFVDKTGIPFFTTQMGKGVIDERHPLFIGSAAFSARDYVHCAIDRADLIINVGHDVIEKPPFFMKEGQQVIHVNFSSAKVDDVYFPQWEVVGDIGNAIWQMKEKIAVSSSWDFSYFLKMKATLDLHIAEKAKSDQFPLIPQRIVHTVRRVMPDDGIVTLDNGMYKLWFARYYQAREQNTLLLDNALATMGAGLPSAMAARLIYPNKKIVAVAGDGGFMMNSQDLETAVREKMHLVIVILNDNGYGMIKWKQAGEEMENFGLEFGNPDFVKYAEAYGAVGHRVTSAQDFEETLAKFLDVPNTYIIEVPIDYSENKSVFTDGLKEEKCDI